MIQPTRSEAILDAIHDEIDRRRQEIDSDDCLITVEVVVSLRSGNGVRKVGYRTQSERKVDN